MKHWILYVVAGALACWWLLGRRVNATVSIGPDVTVGKWRSDLGDALGNIPS